MRLFFMPSAGTAQKSRGGTSGSSPFGFAAGPCLHQIKQLIAAGLGVALLKAGGGELGGNLVLALPRGTLRALVTLLDPLLVAGLLGCVLVGVEHGGQMIVHVAQQLIPRLERGGGQIEGLLGRFGLGDLAVVLLKLLDLRAEGLLFRGGFLRVLLLPLRGLLRLSKLRAQLLDLPLLLGAQRVVRGERVQLARGRIVLLIIKIGLRFSNIGGKLVFRLPGGCLLDERVHGLAQRGGLVEQTAAQVIERSQRGGIVAALNQAARLLEALELVDLKLDGSRVLGFGQCGLKGDECVIKLCSVGRGLCG